MIFRPPAVAQGGLFFYFQGMKGIFLFLALCFTVADAYTILRNTRVPRSEAKGVHVWFTVALWLVYLSA